MKKKIIIYSDQSNDPVRSLSGNMKQIVGHSVDYVSLKKSVIEFYADISSIFKDLKNESEEFQLDEIVINAEIGINGKVGFMGTGVEGSAKSGISFKLKRK